MEAAGDGVSNGLPEREKQRRRAANVLTDDLSAIAIAITKAVVDSAVEPQGEGEGKGEGEETIGEDSPPQEMAAGLKPAKAGDG